MAPNSHFSAFLADLANDPGSMNAEAILSEARDKINSARGHQPVIKMRSNQLVLREFYQLMVVKYDFPLRTIDDPMDFEGKEQLDTLAFPLSETGMIQNLQMYLAVAMKYVESKSHETSRPRLNTIRAKRNAMIGFINRRYWDANREPPAKDKLLSYTNEVLQKCGEVYGVNQTAAKKPYMGRLELAQLIDWDSLRSARPAITEVHHLSWCMANQCGIRPSSIAIPDADHTDRFMRWKDVKITRSQAPGRFDCYLDFVNLKSSLDDLSFTLDKSLKMRPKSPLSTNYIPQSIPHRLLVILLRRDGLQDYPESAFSKPEDRVRQLLKGKEKFIKIREDFAEKALFQSQSPNDPTTTWDKPITRNALSHYLDSRARAAGYGRGVTLYAFRRQAATDWNRQLGPMAAKQLMNHAADSNSLDEYYERGSSNIDITAVALQEGSRRSYQDMDLDTSIAITRAVDLTKTKGKFLTDYVQKCCDTDPEIQAAINEGDGFTAEKRRRTIKRYATAALEEQQRSVAIQDMTLEEFEAKKKELLEPTDLVRRITTRAIELEKMSKPITGVSNNALCPEDLRDQYDPELANADIVVDRDLPDEDIDDSGVTYESVACAFMMSLLEGFKIEDFEGIKCPECLADSTMTEEQRNHIWQATYDLNQHMLGSIHSPYSAWCRSAEMRRKEPGETRYRCPYGVCEMSYTFLNVLVRHIRNSSSKDGALHFSEIEADGWFDDGWKWKPPPIYSTHNNYRRAAGLSYSLDLEMGASEVDRQDYDILSGPIDDVDLEMLYNGGVINGAHANNKSPLDNENLEGGDQVEMDSVDWSGLYGGAIVGGDVR